MKGYVEYPKGSFVPGQKGKAGCGPALEVGCPVGLEVVGTEDGVAVGVEVG